MSAFNDENSGGRSRNYFSSTTFDMLTYWTNMAKLCVQLFNKLYILVIILYFHCMVLQLLHGTFRLNVEFNFRKLFNVKKISTMKMGISGLLY